MAEQRCPTCGGRVIVHAADEGTSSYEAVGNAQLAELLADRARLADALAEIAALNLLLHPGTGVAVALARKALQGDTDG